MIKGPHHAGHPVDPGCASGHNVLLIPVAAGLRFPLAGLLLKPAVVAGAMALSNVRVVTNSLRLRALRAA